MTAVSRRRAAPNHVLKGARVTTGELRKCDPTYGGETFLSLQRVGDNRRADRRPPDVSRRRPHGFAARAHVGDRKALLGDHLCFPKKDLGIAFRAWIFTRCCRNLVGEPEIPRATATPRGCNIVAELFFG